MDKLKLKEINFGYLERYPKGSKSHPKYDWKGLEESILKYGYTPSKFGYVSISSDNYCINGHHRIVLLKELYGDTFEIEVIRLKLPYVKQFTVNVFKQIFKIKWM
jgi:hypothetical protein